MQAQQRSKANARSSYSQASRERGFTLAELAIVILIVVLLLALALPAYREYSIGARDQYGHLVVKADGEKATVVTSFADATASVGPISPDQPNARFAAAVKAHLANATAVFNTPKRVALDSTKTVKLVMSQRKSESELVDQVYHYGESKSVTIKVGRTMQALLVSDDNDGLSVTPKTPSMQSLLPDEETYWLWDAKAKRTGTYKLTLTMSIDSDIDGARLQRAITSHEEEISVTVSYSAAIKRFVAGNWQWLWALLITPAIPWLVRKWRVSRQRKTNLLP